MEEGKAWEAVELRGGKELLDPNKNQNLDTSEEKWSLVNEEENEYGWVDV